MDAKQLETLRTMEALLRVSDTKTAADQLVEAFSAFMEAFMVLKADNESERKAQALQIKTALGKLQAAVSNLKNGKDGRDGKDGKNGANGLNGKTPVAGVDYAVPIMAEILAAMPAAQSFTTADVFKALFLIPDNIIAAINSAESQISAERIEGLEKLIAVVTKKNFPQIYVGTGGLASGGSTSGANVGDELVTAVQSGSNVTIDLTQLSHPYLVVLQVRRNGIPQVRTAVWTQSGATVTVLGADASEYYEVQYTHA